MRLLFSFEQASPNLICILMGLEAEQGACSLLGLTSPELCGIANRRPAWCLTRTMDELARGPEV